MRRRLYSVLIPGILVFWMGTECSIVLGGSEIDRPLDVLLVSAYWGNEATAIEDLLERHGARVTIAGWSDASAKRAEKYDLVIVGGPNRLLHGREAVLDYEGAVLGLGSYGCAYFGKLKLKGGLPET